MEIQKFVIACMLTSITIIIEIIAVISGEGLIFLTILSVLPIYIIARIKPVYSIISYFCISLLLLFLSPHQMVFFALTNGFIGMYLGTFQSKKYISIFKIFWCWIILSFGVCLCLILIGSEVMFLGNWYWITIILMFCLGYALLLYWILPKAYILFKTIYNGYSKRKE